MSKEMKGVKKPKREKVVPEPVQEEPTQKAPEPVMVKNVSNTWFRQPSSGMRVSANETKPMNNDGWLQSQVEAGFLELQ